MSTLSDFDCLCNKVEIKTGLLDNLAVLLRTDHYSKCMKLLRILNGPWEMNRLMSSCDIGNRSQSINCHYCVAANDNKPILQNFCQWFWNRQDCFIDKLCVSPLTSRPIPSSWALFWRSSGSRKYQSRAVVYEWNSERLVVTGGEILVTGTCMKWRHNYVNGIVQPFISTKSEFIGNCGIAPCEIKK